MRLGLFAALFTMPVIGLLLLFARPGPTRSGIAPRAGERRCPLRYPLVLSHHWGIEPLPAGRLLSAAERLLPPLGDPPDNPKLGGRNTSGFYRYFGVGIVDRLRQLGVRLYISDKTPFAANEVRAKELRATVLRALRETGALKVNIIGHSQGAQDSRLLISRLRRFDPGQPAFGGPEDFAMGSRVASWTGLSGEAAGTPVADLALRFFELSWQLHRGIILEVDPVFSQLTTELERTERVAILRQGFHDSLVSLATELPAATGNQTKGPHDSGRDYPDVFYQTYAARVRWPRLAWLGQVPYWLLLSVSRGHGANDMYTSVSSQSHGQLRAVLPGQEGGAGVHHMYFSGRGPEYAATDFMPAAEFYARVVCDLYDQGY